MTSDASLADRVIAVLDAQKKYFKTRDQKDLIASKEMENDLRSDCEFILGTARPANNPKQGSML